MKKQNEVIKIGNNEFVVSVEAKVIFQSYLKNIKKKYRLDKKIYKELENALRDILLELPQRKTTTISKTTAVEATEMVGDDYEGGEGLITRLKNATRSKTKPLLNRFKTTVLTNSFRRKMYYGFAFLMLIPVGLTISSLPMFDANFYSQPNLESQTLDTTLGKVTYGEWANTSLADNPIFSDYSNATQTYSIVLVFLLAFIFLISLAQKSKYTKHVFGLLIVSFVASYGISLNVERSFQNAINNGSYLAYSVPVSREPNDYDKLSACGTQINYVELSDTAGGVYYGLKDQGFVLTKELETQNVGQEPSRAQICSEYDNLRKTYTDESIVLQTFIIDDKGAERPVDFDEVYGRSEKDLSPYKIRYGFYIKTSN
ncbi:hypothetical protein KBB49_00475 [Candidatus Saccharibacteria bacterium]|nr:hypothetical protein [Candidatus Saccharibacteria bacterium]